MFKIMLDRFIYAKYLINPL